MIYTITLTNKKTGREISRDYELSEALEKKDFNMELVEMKESLDNDQENF